MKSFHRFETILFAMLALLAATVGCLQTVPDPASPEMTTATAPTASPQVASLQEENSDGDVYQIPTPKPENLCAAVTASESLHLRAERTEKSAVLAYLAHGEQVEVIDPNNRWWKVTTRAGKTGYANSRYLQAEQCCAQEQKCR